MVEPGTWVIDVGDAEFEREVLDASSTTPVVVDFWAPWCGPCRALAPILEKLAEEKAGEFVLARVNIDESQQIAGVFGVTSIPAVKGFRDGRLVAEFLGAQPESEVRRFLAQVLPSEADLHVRRGDEAWVRGDRDTAANAYDEALALDAHHRGAGLGLARCRADRGDVDAALALLDRWVPGDPDAEQLAAELRLRAPEGAAGDAALDALQQRIDADPEDHAARLEYARGAVAAGRHEAALGALLASIERDAHWDGDAARQLMLDIFSSLGGDHPLTQDYRAALARVLYR